ncbi:MAG: replication factor C large subunit [archaeon]
MSEPWTKKYKPSIKEIYGQDKAVQSVISYLKNWRPRMKPVLLYGSPGTGKTAVVEAAAKEGGYELVELNASDERNAAAISSKAVSAATQASLFGNKKIILLDEIDGLYGTKDRGAIPTIVELIEKARYPIILTANDPYRQNIRSLRDKCVTVHFQKLDSRSIASRLAEICKAESISASKEVLQSVAQRSGGDMRSAILDLQSIAAGKKEVSQKDVDLLSSRDQVRDIFETLKLIFKSSTIETAIQAMNESDKSPDDLFLWVRENLPLEYSGVDLARAYAVLSRADMFRSRIMRQQYWGYLRYTLELISAGVSVSKSQKNPNYIKYKPPTLLLKYGRYRFTRAARDGLARKIAAATHSSSQDVIRALPYYRILARDKGFAEKISAELKLDESEVKYIAG